LQALTLTSKRLLANPKEGMLLGSEDQLSVRYRISKATGLNRMSTKSQGEDLPLFIVSVFEGDIAKRKENTNVIYKFKINWIKNKIMKLL